MDPNTTTPNPGAVPAPAPAPGPAPAPAPTPTNEPAGIPDLSAAAAEFYGPVAIHRRPYSWGGACAAYIDKYRILSVDRPAQDLDIALAKR